MRLAGRVAIVSGGSRGIGTGIAKCMAREGASVVVNYFKSEGPAHDVVRDIEAAGGTAVAIKADVGDYGEVEAMVEETVSKFGKLDIMVANAGTKGHGKALIELTHDEFAYTIRNHLMGAFNCSRAALPHLRNGVRGDLILISSRSTDMLMANDSDYNAAKAAIDALAKGVAKEERYHGVRVNAVNPGLVPTDMAWGGISRTTGMDTFEEVDKGMPLGRMVRAEDIGNLCVFLASEEGSHISGEVIYVRAAVGAELPPNYLPSWRLSGGVMQSPVPPGESGEGDPIHRLLALGKASE